MNTSDIRNAIEKGQTALGIEFGSTRIKAVLIGPDHAPLASGSHEWENRYENGVWTYSLDDVWNGLQACFRDLRATVQGARRVADSPALVDALQSLNAALKEVRELVRELRTGAAPELKATLEEARRSLAAAQSTLAADSPLQSRLNAALDELAAAARALRALADYLERHPEAAVFGKGNEK